MLNTCKVLLRQLSTRATFFACALKYSLNKGRFFGGFCEWIPVEVYTNENLKAEMIGFIE